MYLCSKVHIYKQCEQLCNNTFEPTIKASEACKITYRNYECSTRAHLSIFI
jgi:hypothetical protein